MENSTGIQIGTKHDSTMNLNYCICLLISTSNVSTMRCIAFHFVSKLSPSYQNWHFVCRFVLNKNVILVVYLVNISYEISK